VNIATQLLISIHSKSPHYDPSTPDAHVPDLTGYVRDEVGLMRAIAVKVCLCVIIQAIPRHEFQIQERSSAKRKELFRNIQLRDPNATVSRQLMIDMKVRWGSTYVMIHRGLQSKPVCFGICRSDGC
jgi:hypothetical protein